MSIWIIAIIANIIFFIAEWVMFYVATKISPPDSIIITILASLSMIGLLFGLGGDKLVESFDYFLTMSASGEKTEGFATLIVLAIGTPFRWSVLGLSNWVVLRAVIKENNMMMSKAKDRKVD